MNPGTKIVRSFELMECVWLQIENLCASLSALTENALNDGEFAGLRSAGAANFIDEWSASGYTSASRLVSVPVTSKRRRNSKATAWINYQISVFGGGIPPLRTSGDESLGPVLHVSFWLEKSDPATPELYMTFPPAWSDYAIRNDRLLFWENDDDETPAQWTYSLRLLSLDSEDTLRTSVIGPVGALLGGADVETALPAKTPGLVFYENAQSDASGSALVARD